MLDAQRRAPRVTDMKTLESLTSVILLPSHHWLTATARHNLLMGQLLPTPGCLKSHGPQPPAIGTAGPTWR